MPDAEGYHIDDPGLPQITTPAGVSGGVFELGFTTSGVKLSKRLPAAVLLQFVGQNLPGPNNRRDMRKHVRQLSSSAPGFGALGPDSALDTLDPAFLCLNTVCTVEFEGTQQTWAEYVLRYDPAGTLQVYRDGTFQNGGLVPARWVRVGSAEAVAAGVPAFNPATTRYLAGSQVIYQLRLWQTATELVRSNLPGDVIPTPSEAPDNPWKEISRAPADVKEQTLGRTLALELLGEDQIVSGRTYRITGRPDGFDVLVRGLNAAGLAYADAYTVPAGVDAPVEPVAYDIATDTVSPRSGGTSAPLTLINDDAQTPAASYVAALAAPELGNFTLLRLNSSYQEYGGVQPADKRYAVLDGQQGELYTGTNYYLFAPRLITAIRLSSTTVRANPAFAESFIQYSELANTRIQPQGQRVVLENVQVTGAVYDVGDTRWTLGAGTIVLRGTTTIAAGRTADPATTIIDERGTGSGSSYTLPAGSATVRGGYRVGTGLTVTDGDVLNVTASGGVPTTPLAVPTGLTLTATGTSTATVSWNPVAGNSGYYVQIATNSTFSENLTGRLIAQDVTSLSLTGLSAYTTYYVRVFAVGSGSYNHSGYTTAVSARTQAGSLVTERVNDTDARNVYSASGWQYRLFDNPDNNQLGRDSYQANYVPAGTLVQVQVSATLSGANDEFFKFYGQADWGSPFDVLLDGTIVYSYEGQAGTGPPGSGTLTQVLYTSPAGLSGPHVFTLRKRATGSTQAVANEFLYYDGYQVASRATAPAPPAGAGDPAPAPNPIGPGGGGGSGVSKAYVDGADDALRARIVTLEADLLDAENDINGLENRVQELEEAPAVPATPTRYFTARKTGNQSVIGGDFERVTFQALDREVGATAGAGYQSDSRYIVPQTGLWNVSGALQFLPATSLPGGVVYLCVFVNGQRFRDLFILGCPANNEYFGASGVREMWLQQGDVVELQTVNTTSGGVLIADNQARMGFSMRLLSTI